MLPSKGVRKSTAVKLPRDPTDPRSWRCGTSNHVSPALVTDVGPMPGITVPYPNAPTSQYVPPTPGPLDGFPSTTCNPVTNASCSNCGALDSGWMDHVTYLRA